jgi:ABC-type uncharacterized transport system substrate-binding protein
LNPRRQLLIALGLGALVVPLGSLAQQRGKVWRIGFFYFGTRQSASESGRYGAFLEGMRELHYVEGKDFTVEARFADGTSEPLENIAAELARLKMDVIVATGTGVFFALKHASRTVPVVITGHADPVSDGFAASLAHPGGNFTGLSTGNVELYPKWIELIKTAVPNLSRVAVLWNSNNPGHPERLNALLPVIRKAGIRALEVDGRSASEIERGFTQIRRQGAQAVVVLTDIFFAQQYRQIATLALKQGLPSLDGSVDYPEFGGLMGYGQSAADRFRRAASFVDKILKGAKPGELPFEQPMRLQLVINRKTAKAIGITIPQELLLRADKVIE